MSTACKVVIAAFATIALFARAEYSFGQTKATITVKKEVNGATVVESRVIELNETSDMNAVLKEMGVYDENNEIIPGREFQISINQSSGDSFIPPAAPSAPSRPTPPPFAALPPVMEEKAYLGVIVKTEHDGHTSGVSITEVIPGTAAAEAGLQVGDFIYKIEDTDIENQDALVSYIQSRKPSNPVKIHFKRGGKKKSVKCNLGKKDVPSMAMIPEIDFYDIPNFDYFFNPDSIVIIRPEDGKRSCDSMKICQPFSWDDEGFRTMKTPFLGITPAETASLKGVTIGSIIPESCAEKMGLQEGDIILEINEVAIANFDDLRNDIQVLEPGASIRVKILRDGKEKILKGELGHKSTSVLDDFRIYHDFKGMDENGDFNYDFELDMDIEDLEEHMKDLLDQLKYESQHLADRLEFQYKRGESAVEGKINISDASAYLEIPGLYRTAEPLKFEKFILHPDEGGKRLILEFELSLPAETEISVIDQEGIRVYYELRGSVKNGYNGQIDFSTLAKGNYYLIVKSSGNSFVRKIEKY